MKKALQCLVIGRALLCCAMRETLFCVSITELSSAPLVCRLAHFRFVPIRCPFDLTKLYLFFNAHCKILSHLVDLCDLEIVSLLHDTAWLEFEPHVRVSTFETHFHFGPHAIETT